MLHAGELFYETSLLSAPVAAGEGPAGTTLRHRRLLGSFQLLRGPAPLLVARFQVRIDICLHLLRRRLRSSTAAQYTDGTPSQ